MVKTVCFSGYCGTRNTGDELLLDAAVAGCRRKLGMHKVNVLAAFPHEVAELHRDCTIAGVARNTGWQRTGHVVEDKAPAAEQEALDLIDRSDALVIVGGGLWGNGTVYSMAEVRHAAAQGKPVFAISMGVDPFKLDLGHYYRDNYFRHLRQCSTRDLWGALCLEYIGVQEVTRVVSAVDSVVWLFADMEQPPKCEKAYICICNNRGWKNHIPAGMTMETTARAIGRGLVEACKPYRVAPMMFPFSPDQCGEYDWVRAHQFVAQSECSIEVANTRGLDQFQIFELLGEARVLVSERYHACVMAACAGVPFVALCMDHKLREVARYFGMPHIALAEHMIEARVYAAVREVLGDHERLVRQLADRVGDAKQAAWLHFRDMEV